MRLFVYSPTHGRCEHEHSSYVTLARCLMSRNACGVVDDAPMKAGDGRGSFGLLGPELASLNQVIEVAAYEKYLRGIGGFYSEDRLRVEKQLDLMALAGEGKVQGTCPLCGASAKITCSKSCAYNRFHGRPVHVPQIWWESNRRTP